MKSILSFLILSLSLYNLHAQDQEFQLETYAFYDSSGAPLTFNQVINTLTETEVILFGELHNDAMVHYLQLRIINTLMSNNELVLGGEFFERDDQLKIDEYLSGLVPARNFESEAKLWTNYKTDYKPILDLAKDSGMTFIATNVPRRYAAMVAKSGLDVLKSTTLKEARPYLPDLPVEFSLATPKYQEMLDMMGGHSSDPELIVQAQALKDATMAESIYNNLQKNSIFIHINGDFHSASYGGIYWYLKKLKPKLNIKTIKVFAGDTLGFDSEYKGTGHIILVVPKDFTKTH